MNLSFEKLSLEHKYPVMEIYNYYIEHTFAAFPGTKLPSNFYEKILEDIKDYPAYAVKLDDKIVGFCYLCSYKNYKTLRETAEVICYLSYNAKGKGIGYNCLKKLEDDAREMGLKNLRIAASSLTSAHNGLVAHIENGVVNRIETSGLRGKLAQAVSEGALEYPAVIRSHGGRARAISSGDVKIDVAFIAASSADCMGNANGVRGKSICGAMGYAKVDAQHAEKVVVVTDTLVPYPNFPQSIPQTQVDYVCVVEEVGDSSGIMSGATRFTNNPKELLQAKRAVEVMKATGLFVDGFSMQTGSGGATLAVTRFVKDELIKQDIKLSYALGGITAPMVDLLEMD